MSLALAKKLHRGWEALHEGVYVSPIIVKCTHCLLVGDSIVVGTDFCMVLEPTYLITQMSTRCLVFIGPLNNWEAPEFY